MSKTLIIAEKPSVAADIARALGGFTRQDDYFESDDYVLSSAVGHLLEIGMPEEDEVKRGKWTFAHLPVIPPQFDLKPIEKNEARLKVLLQAHQAQGCRRHHQRLRRRPRGRADLPLHRPVREGAKADPAPVAAVDDARGDPRRLRARCAATQTMRPLADAATCRSEADWLVGINGTRAMTAFNSKSGGFQLTTVGRVQTPTLAILVEREAKIREFVPRDYWEVHGTFAAQAGEYTGRWFDEGLRKREDDAGRARRAALGRGTRRAPSARSALGKPGVVTEETKPTTQISPLLYDLTSLQREANGRFGFSARTTLSLAQALYEKHKVLTYPRTDSRALPEDYLGTVRATLEMLGESNAYGTFAPQDSEGEVGHARTSASSTTARSPTTSRSSRRCRAEAPERGRAEALRPGRQALPRGVLSGGGVPRHHADHARRGRAVQDRGQGAGRTRAGSRSTARKRSGDEPTLAPVRPTRNGADRTRSTGQAQPTRPPPRYNEATLLSAMEGAGKLVEDEELREAMREKGLGTPATRAQIIEGLISERYVYREGKELRAHGEGVLADDAAARAWRSPSSSRPS